MAPTLQIPLFDSCWQTKRPPQLRSNQIRRLH